MPITGKVARNEREDVLIGLVLKDSKTGEQYKITEVHYPPEHSAHPIPWIRLVSLDGGPTCDIFQDELTWTLERA